MLMQILLKNMMLKGQLFEFMSNRESEIYNKFMPYVDKIYSTIFLKEADNADTYFPFDSLDDFRVSNIERHFSEDHDCNYLFVTYEKVEGGNGE